VTRARDLADQARADGVPRKERYSLQSQRREVRSPVCLDAIRAAGRDPDEPGAADQYWFEDLDIIVIDLQDDG
jgi:hypothetical protein